MRQECGLYSTISIQPLLSSAAAEALSTAVRKEKEIKDTKIE